MQTSKIVRKARFRLRAVSSVRLTKAWLKKLEAAYTASLQSKLGSERSERSSRRKHSFISS
ncbi:hypothetical protein HMPREF1325_0175 [Treponema socranskii subsp. socranskii VPI DR56BR1116 = ATCC 35536]|uniref:Uncharacterized protein n=1 Tax=Treponema socranskii subsp. socranskii VPI DR56BR1116 = ATCC 35536 TaxID=1125725 RepID=U1GWV3_TRESO|nr:hypothetical protein HMPREF1325_0175 [Treponema socranskii subsp. socranskii VPI DR56BR1116 = ATCC 35536]